MRYKQVRLVANSSFGPKIGTVDNKYKYAYSQGKVQSKQVLVVTAFTPGYADLAQRLSRSVAHYGLDIVSMPYKSRGSWEANGQIKPDALMYALSKSNGRDLLWIDADAEVTAAWDYTLPHGADLAVHYLRGELLSGTVLIRNSKVRGVVDAWNVACGKNSRVWDQRALDKAINGVKLKVAKLPPKYCWIYDISLKIYGDNKPVITHYQASRQVKSGKRKL